MGLFLTQEYTVPAFSPVTRLMASMLLPSLYIDTARDFTSSDLWGRSVPTMK